MAASQYPQVFAGEILTAGLLQSFAPLTVVKAANQTVTSSTTLVNDSDLSAAVAASATYWLDCILTYEGGPQGTSDLKFAWAVPAGTTMACQQNGITTAGASTIGFARGVSGGTAGTSGSGNQWTMRMSGTVTVSTTPGTLQLQWAQNTSNGVGTIVHAGSGLLLVRVK